MKFQHILHAVHAEPWLITAEGHHAIALLIESQLAKASLENLVAADHAARLQSGKDFFGNEIPAMRVEGGIAEIPIIGTIGKGLGKLEKSCGATSVEDISKNCAEAADRHDVRGVILNIHSPGGTIPGLPETAADIRALVERKPVVAFTDGLMASAAYWLGSQANTIVATPSASLGSIGVMFPLLDRSRQMEAMGIKVDVIKNAEATYKAMGLPGLALTEAQRAHLQERADEIFAMFKGDVLARRAQVKADAMRGQVLLGASAKKAGLCDDVGGYGMARAALDSLIRIRESKTGTKR